VTAVLGGAEGADEGVVVALAVEADKVDLFVAVALLRAVNVLYDVRRDFHFHYQRYILNVDQQDNIVIAYYPQLSPTSTQNP
jgi:hypothetical protein